MAQPGRIGQVTNLLSKARALGWRGDAVVEYLPGINMHSLHFLLGVIGDNPMGTQICSTRLTLEAEVGT